MDFVALMRWALAALVFLIVWDGVIIMAFLVEGI